MEAEVSYIVVARWRYNYASARRRKNVIRGLLTDEGEWVQSEESLQSVIGGLFS